MRSAWAEPLKWRDRPSEWLSWQDKLALPCEPIFALEETCSDVELAIVPEDDELVIKLYGDEYLQTRKLTRLDAVGLSLALAVWLEGTLP